MDTCECGHVFDEHYGYGDCEVNDCSCIYFEAVEECLTVVAVDKGGW